MALIEVGSFDKFSASFQPSAFEIKNNVKGLKTIKDTREATRVVQKIPLDFETSKTNCGLALKSIRLYEDFGGFFSKLFDPKYNIYFFSWSWDLSGNPPSVYPAESVPVEQIRIPMKAGNIREFIGEGILLHPPKKIKSGLAVRMNIWESDEDLREVGKTIVEVTETIKNSNLNALLSLVSGVTGIPGITVTLIENASIQLANVIGQILKANSDDYVDFFEGYYQASTNWMKSEEETIHGYGCEISLKKFT